MAKKQLVEKIVNLYSKLGGNKVFPHKTARFTGETSAKSVTANGNSNIHISDFFYATTDSEDSKKVIISSLLMGEDGSACTISSNFGTVSAFTDNQDQNRMGDYWTIDSEGKFSLGLNLAGSPCLNDIKPSVSRFLVPVAMSVIFAGAALG